MQDNECIIGGLFDHGTELRLDLDMVKQSWDFALVETDIVWLSTARNGFTLMPFPFWPLGNLSFFFKARYHLKEIHNTCYVN